MTKIQIHEDFTSIPAEQWDALVGDGSPFLEHAFLQGLIDHGCATPERGWAAHPVTVWEGERLVAAAPAWLTGHSMGEFVYDHSWANAAERAGIPYYPKVVVAVPFTPVAGQRLLVARGEDVETRRAQLLAALSQLGEQTSGLHLLFNPESCALDNASAGLFSRIQYQFHWHNDGYRDFEDWLGQAFRSKARNKIRRERRDALAEVQVDVIQQPDSDIIDAVYGFYTDTCRQFGPWGRVYLTRSFIDHLADVWGHRLHCVIARRNGRPVGGTLNIHKGSRLYGRYWGCTEDLKFLHFEVCYYRPIEWCIAHGIQVFEPGHGGGHKYRRGFRPELTWSSHRLTHPGLHRALQDHTERESEAVRGEVIHLRDRQTSG